VNEATTVITLPKRLRIGVIDLSTNQPNIGFFQQIFIRTI